MMSHELIVTRMKACDDEETCFFWYYRFCSKVSLGPSFLLWLQIEKLNGVIKELIEYKEEEKEMLNGIIRN
ncbi:hypothetical protein HanXRQr2_Chr12g0526321 [Helianthus annuus]|uniref:Uncharacterized protein n=1 Tax=Helianthus annuus TaxID=4232 RepID=A0A9K3EMN3_HELAN|nr:hypothetical protein HanXRQr2_Chr12g0526321 [Helianthus annuus]KAJ0861476.1 hypothetical protein HanPSC8_Chr12g0507091 [Helianthus annuus]